MERSKAAEMVSAHLKELHEEQEARNYPSLNDMMKRQQEAAMKAATRNVEQWTAKAEVKAKRGLVHTSLRRYEEVYRTVKVTSQRLDVHGPMDLGGGVSLTHMRIEHSLRDMSEIVEFHLLLPDGNVKYYKGPVDAFRECYTAREIVMRALEHSEGE